MSLTDRYVCLSCGRFWRTDHEMKPGESYCPYCGDRYYCDNVIADVPPPINDYFTFVPTCGHSTKVDLPGDFQFCCVCGTRRNINPNEDIQKQVQFSTIKDYQINVIMEKLS
jgi:DNA-directed RNA polymerase subunit RPC12/RpoP